MAITATQVDGVDLARVTTLSHLDDAASPDAASITVGRNPRYVRVENATDRTLLEWYEGMTTAHAVKTVAAGTRTLLTSAGITVVDDVVGFAVVQSKQYRVYIVS